MRSARPHSGRGGRSVALGTEDGNIAEIQSTSFRDRFKDAGTALWRFLPCLYRRRTLLSFVLGMGALTLVGFISAETSAWFLTLASAVIAAVAVAAPVGRDDPSVQKILSILLGLVAGVFAGLIPLGAAAENDRCPEIDDAPSSLSLDEMLASGQSLASPSGRFVLTMHESGQLILCDRDSGAELWDLLTGDHPQAYAKLQPDGNFVIRSKAHDFLWGTNSDNTDAELLRVEDSGRVTLVARAGPPLWVSSGVAAVMFASSPPRVQNELSQWEALRQEEALRSPNGTYRLVMRADGDLALYRRQELLWHTNTGGNHGSALAMQEDGNLVLYAEPYNPDPSRRVALWSSATDGSDALKLHLDDNGLLALVGPDGVLESGVLFDAGDSLTR